MQVTICGREIPLNWIKLKKEKDNHKHALLQKNVDDGVDDIFMFYSFCA